MTGTTLEADTQTQAANQAQSGEQNPGQNGNENQTPTAKQNPNSKPKPNSIRYLSEFINEIPETRRIACIVKLKQAIKSNQFDGVPIAESFMLNYVGRGAEGPEKRETNQRDYVVENSAAFKTWLAEQAVEIPRGAKYATRTQFEGGQVNLAELAAKYRQRGGSSKGKGRR